MIHEHEIWMCVRNEIYVSQLISIASQRKILTLNVFSPGKTNDVRFMVGSMRLNIL